MNSQNIALSCSVKAADACRRGIRRISFQTHRDFSGWSTALLPAAPPNLALRNKFYLLPILCRRSRYDACGILTVRAVSIDTVTRVAFYRPPIRKKATWLLEL